MKSEASVLRLFADPVGRVVLASLTLLDSGVLLDGSIYFRGLGASLAPTVLALAVTAHLALLWRSFRGVLFGHSAQPNSCAAFALGFSVMPVSGLAGGWSFALGSRGGLQELAGDTITIVVFILSCGFGYLLMTWMKSIAAEVRRTKRARAVDAREMVALRVYRGALFAAIGMLGLRLLYVGSVPTRAADFPMVYCWGAAAFSWGFALQSVRTRRVHRRAWLKDVSALEVEGYRIEPIHNFADAARIPPFQSTASGTYQGVLVKESAGKIEVLGRVA